MPIIAAGIADYSVIRPPYHEYIVAAWTTTFAVAIGILWSRSPQSNHHTSDQTDASSLRETVFHPSSILLFMIVQPFAWAFFYIFDGLAFPPSLDPFISQIAFEQRKVFFLLRTQIFVWLAISIIYCISRRFNLSRRTLILMLVMPIPEILLRLLDIPNFWIISALIVLTPIAAIGVTRLTVTWLESSNFVD